MVSISFLRVFTYALLPYAVVAAAADANLSAVGQTPAIKARSGNGNECKFTMEIKHTCSLNSDGRLFYHHKLRLDKMHSHIQPHGGDLEYQLDSNPKYYAINGHDLHMVYKSSAPGMDLEFMYKECSWNTSTDLYNECAHCHRNLTIGDPAANCSTAKDITVWNHVSIGCSLFFYLHLTPRRLVQLNVTSNAPRDSSACGGT